MSGASPGQRDRILEGALRPALTEPGEEGDRRVEVEGVGAGPRRLEGQQLGLVERVDDDPEDGADEGPHRSQDG